MITTKKAAFNDIPKVSRLPIWLCAINWLINRDAAYRASHKLRNMPEERLDDMGITREQANAAFYTQGSRRIDITAEPITLQAFRRS